MSLRPKTLRPRPVLYVITSIPFDRMDEVAPLKPAGAHWQTESRLFCFHDGALAEDSCHDRPGNAAIALVHITAAALALIRQRKLQPKSNRNVFAVNPKAAIRITKSE